MKILHLTFFVFTFLCGTTLAQSPGDSLFIDNGLPPHAYYQGDENISFRTMKKIMRSNEEAYELIKKASKKRNSGRALCVLGFVFLAGSPGAATSTGELVALIAVSGAIIGTSISLSIKANELTRMAIQVYNRDVHSNPNLIKPH